MIGVKTGNEASAGARLHAPANWGLVFRVIERFGIIQGSGGITAIHSGFVCQTMKPVFWGFRIFPEVFYMLVFAASV